MVSAKAFVADSDKASVTLTVKFEVPVLVGVPEMVPVELRVRLAGSDPAETPQTRVPVPPLAWRV
jgi:hypothetical protein